VTCVDRRRRTARSAFVAVAIGVIGLLGAGPALAHNALTDSDPADGASLAAAPTAVTLTFNDVVQNLQPVVAVIGPDSNRWQGSPVSVLNNTVSVPVNPLGPAGTYTIAYRVISADGHAVEGVTTFQLTAAGAGTPNPAEGGGQNAPDSIPAWVWVLGAGLVVVAVIVAGIVTTRRRTADQTD
jgi:methionine-rich copper-binding protein CopC